MDFQQHHPYNLSKYYFKVVLGDINSKYIEYVCFNQNLEEMENVLKKHYEMKKINNENDNKRYKKKLNKNNLSLSRKK